MSHVSKIRDRATYANVTATLALFVALGGGSFAVAALSGSEKKVVKKIAKKQANKQITARAPGLSVASAQTAQSADTAQNAGSADDSARLGGELPSAFQTQTAFQEAESETALTTSFSTVISTEITIPSTKSVVAFASIQGSSDGGDNDALNCALEIAGAEGVNPETDVNDGAINRAVMPLTQARTLPAGTHTVLVKCAETGTVIVEERSLSVVATG